MKFLIWGLLAFALLLGAATTYEYLRLLPHGAQLPWAALLLGLGLAKVFTLANLMLRWMRWHFLTRRFAVFFRTRHSLRLYFASLPLLAVPLFLGELLRPWTISASEPRARRVVLQVWFLERVIDVGVLVSWWLVGSRQLGWAAASLFGSWALASTVLARFERRRGNPRPKRDGAVFGGLVLCASALAWLLPSAALFGTLWLLDSPTSIWGVVEAFSASTLVGGFSGLPLGMGITGPQAVEHLVRQDTARDVAIWAVLVLRLGTAWFAVALGAVLLALWWRRLPRLSADDPSAHFDALAPAYVKEIPDHMRERLLLRKTRLMLPVLAERGVPSEQSGLDLGCGQGWYAIEMAQQGFSMSGTDASRGQLNEARSNAERHGVMLDLRHNEPGSLPFPDLAFDFVYTINVIHHVLEDEHRKTLFRDIMRVLRPGGVVFLHEINTLNPLFRFYMSYVFPLLRRIDEGNERWINPKALPEIPGGRWVGVEYFTFLPDFLPARLVRWLRPLEELLEHSPLRHLSAHYVAVLVKDPDPKAAAAATANRAPATS